MFHLTIQPNSWYITRHIKECNSLFSDTEDIYVQAFTCKCGKEHIRIANTQTVQVPYFICPKCTNGYFINVDNFNFDTIDINIDKVSIQKQQNDTIVVNFSYQKPYAINLASNSLKYHTNLVMQSIYQDSHIHSEYFYQIDAELETILKIKSIDNIANHIYPDSSQKKLREKASILRFRTLPSFIHKTIIDIDIFDEIKYIKEELTPLRLLDHIRAKHNQKSLKRVLFKLYHDALAYKQPFDAITPYIIFHSFDDINIIYTLLSQNISLINPTFKEHEKLIFDESIYSHFSHTHIRLIRLLKTKYQEKSIANLLQKTQSNIQLWHDTVALFSYIQDNNELQLPDKITPLTLHDTFMHINMISFYKNRNTPFKYESKFINASKTIKNLTFKLPQNPIELLEWGDKLNNCLRIYISDIKHKRSTIFGVFEQNNRLLYAVEIKHNTIAQSYGRYNRPIPEDDKKIVSDWFEKFFK